MTVLALDPGGTTGWATWDASVGFRSWECDFDVLIARAWEWITTQPDAHEGARHVVCERYTITAETLRKSRQSDALEIIGFMRGLCLIYEIPFSLQTPADAKRFSTDDRLRHVGWYTRGKGHANDAARHLMLHLVKNRLMEPPRA